MTSASVPARPASSAPACRRCRAGRGRGRGRRAVKPRCEPFSSPSIRLTTVASVSRSGALARPCRILGAHGVPVAVAELLVVPVVAHGPPGEVERGGVLLRQVDLLRAREAIAAVAAAAPVRIVGRSWSPRRTRPDRAAATGDGRRRRVAVPHRLARDRSPARRGQADDLLPRLSQRAACAGDVNSVGFRSSGELDACRPRSCPRRSP